MSDTKRRSVSFRNVATLLCQYSICRRIFAHWRLSEVLQFESCVEVLLSGLNTTADETEEDDLSVNSRLLATIGSCYWKKLRTLSVEKHDRDPRTGVWNHPDSIVVQHETIAPLSTVASFFNRIAIRLRESGNTTLERFSIVETARRITDWTDFYGPTFGEILRSLLRETIRTESLVIDCCHGGFNFTEYIVAQAGTLIHLRFCYGSSVRTLKCDMANMAVANVLESCSKLQKIALRQIGLTDLIFLREKLVTTASICRVGRTNLQGIGLTFDTAAIPVASVTLAESVERLQTDLGFCRWAFSDVAVTWRRLRHLCLDCVDFRSDLAAFPTYANPFQFLDRRRFPSMDILLLMLPSSALSGKLRALESAFAVGSWQPLFTSSVATSLTLLIDAGEHDWSRDVLQVFRTDIVPRNHPRLTVTNLGQSILEYGGLKAKYQPAHFPVVHGLRLNCDNCNVDVFFGAFNATQWFLF